jgi:SRSO17 transposase
MDAKQRSYLDQLLAECRVAGEVFEDVLPRLMGFMQPFVQSLARREAREHAITLVSGLLSDVTRKNVESIAYRFAQDRMSLQRFVGWAEWDDAPLREELARQIGSRLGTSDGILVLDPSGFPKSGYESVGVARQWCGRLGKVDNCQVAVYLGYVSQHGHALVDTHLYLPKEWTKDRARLNKARVPKDRRRFRTRHQLALELLQQHRSVLPHNWVTGDDEMGRPAWFRSKLGELGERYMLSVPSTTLIRDLDANRPPPPIGRGRPRERPWQRVDRWAMAQPESAWTTIDVRDGAKGPLLVQILIRRVQARDAKHAPGPEELLVVVRTQDREQHYVTKIDYNLSNAAADVPATELARVVKAEHCIEECLQRAKSEAGLADYEVRNWTGWQHHQTLSLIASWFLVLETRRGKKMDTCPHRTTDPRGHRPDPPRLDWLRRSRTNPPRARIATATKRAGALLSLEET